MYEKPNHCLDECACEERSSCCREWRCWQIVIMIFGALFFFSAGALVGALTSTMIIMNIAAVLVFTAILLLLTVISIVLAFCRRCR